MEPLNVRIAPAVLDEPVVGSNLYAASDGPATLRAQLDPFRPTLLLFLRHFGCLFCREMVKDVRIAADRADALHVGNGEKRFPRVVFVHQGTPEQGARFFGRYWPGAAAISDPGKRLYEALSVVRASPMQLFGPRACACVMRAVLKGHMVGRPIGDPWTMPGIFVVAADGRVLHRHRFAHAADHPAFEEYADVEVFLARRAADCGSAADVLVQPA